MTLRRVATLVALLVVMWLILLAALGAVQGKRIAAQVTERVGESLAGNATIGESSLSLVRGRLELDNLVVRRDDLTGHLALDVAEVRAELAPAGLALLDRDVRTLSVRGVRLEVSAAAMFQLRRPKHPPMHADRVILDDAVLTFSPSAFLPSLGAITIRIDHASSGPTVLRTPLSWLLTLDELRAHLELPAGITVQLTYAHGVVSAAGSLFGSDPVTLPIELHVDHVAADAREEVQQLVALGKSLAERLVEKRANDWLNSKLFKQLPATVSPGR